MNYSSNLGVLPELVAKVNSDKNWQISSHSGYATSASFCNPFVLFFFNLGHELRTHALESGPLAFADGLVTDS